MGQVMARAVLVGGGGCVLLVRLRASFLLVEPGGISLGGSPESRAGQIGEGEAETSGQGYPVVATCYSRKRRRRAHHRSTLRRRITVATILGHTPYSQFITHTRTGDVSMLPLCLVAHLAYIIGCIAVVALRGRRVWHDNRAVVINTRINQDAFEEHLVEQLLQMSWSGTVEARTVLHEVKHRLHNVSGCRYICSVGVKLTLNTLQLGRQLGLFFLEQVQWHSTFIVGVQQPTTLVCLSPLRSAPTRPGDSTPPWLDPQSSAGYVGTTLPPTPPPR